MIATQASCSGFPGICPDARTSPGVKAHKPGSHPHIAALSGWPGDALLTSGWPWAWSVLLASLHLMLAKPNLGQRGNLPEVACPSHG